MPIANPIIEVTCYSRMQKFINRVSGNISTSIFEGLFVNSFFFFLRGEVDAVFWWRSLKESELLEDLEVDGRIILKWILKKWDETLTGLIWFSIGRGRSFLWMPRQTSVFHKSRGILRLAEDLLATQEWLCSMELVYLHIIYLSIYLFT